MARIKRVRRSSRWAEARPSTPTIAPPSSGSEIPTFLRLIARSLEDLAMSEELRRARSGGFAAVPAQARDKGVIASHDDAF